MEEHYLLGIKNLILGIIYISDLSHNFYIKVLLCKFKLKNFLIQPDAMLNFSLHLQPTPKISQSFFSTIKALNPKDDLSLRELFINNCNLIKSNEKLCLAPRNLLKFFTFSQKDLPPSDM